MTFAEIRSCIDLLLAHAEARGFSEVTPPAIDHYWTIPAPDWRMPYSEPTLGAGSFADDETQLAKLRRDASRASAVDLERMASLLRLLSDQLVE